MTEWHGVVAAGHAETVDAAARVLRAGGNAYDATVAAGVAAAVAEPGLTSLGGGGFLLARTAGEEEVLFDFFVDTPGKGRDASALDPHFTPVTIAFRGTDQVFNVGYGSVAVPGCLAGYLHVHERLGRLPLADVLAPARRLAHDGVVITRQQAELFGLLEKVFTLTEEGRSIFGTHDTYLGEGDVFRNPELGDFLRMLAEGRHPDGFADPEMAAAIQTVMDDRDGLVTSEDLADYRVVEREPLTFEYRGARVLTNPPPSFGGTLVSHALSMLESAGSPQPRGTRAHLGLLADVLEETANRRVSLAPISQQGTTHVSVCDADGNIAAMTTSNGSGSGTFVPGVGVMLNNMLGEEDLHPGGIQTVPGVRVSSMMAPTVVVPRKGEPIALGSGGSERIRSAMTQVIANVVDYGLSAQDAVDAPRVHWDGSVLQVEPGFDEDELASLRNEREINVWDRPNLYFGGAHAASPSGECAGDPRRGGCTEVVDHGDR